LIRRTKPDLDETKKLVPSATTSSVFPCSVSDEQAVKDVSKATDKWDVLIMGAAHEPIPGPLMQQELSDWWKGYEVRMNTHLELTMISANKFRLTSNPLSSLPRHSFQRPVLTLACSQSLPVL
jgi:NADP-dependent 3-hydroxy acid dehydrogenase YdfG